MRWPASPPTPPSKWKPYFLLLPRVVEGEWACLKPLRAGSSRGISSMLRGVLIGMAFGAYLTGLVTWIVTSRPDHEAAREGEGV